MESARILLCTKSVDHSSLRYSWKEARAHCTRTSNAQEEESLQLQFMQGLESLTDVATKYLAHSSENKRVFEVCFR